MTPNKPLLVLLAGFALAAGAVAQQPPPAAIVGATAQVQGLVTVSVGTTVANVANESPVIDGSRYVTSSTGRAELRFKDGCIVKLEPNQWTFIDAATDCSKRMAAVYFISDSSAVAGLGGGGSGMLPFVAGAALLLGGVISSGSGSGSGSSSSPVGGNIPVPPITPPPAQ